MEDQEAGGCKDVVSLEAACESAVIQGFKDTISTGKFTCGGTVQGFPKVQLNYLQTAGQWIGVTFPDLKAAKFQNLIQFSTIASFGKGKKNVSDKNYCDAYALDPDKFLASFQLSDSGILGEVQSLLAPDAFSIGAELYKLNIYAGPTGCFKSHVDTPRGHNMFGSLVVCLPSQFAGGALLTRHNGEQITYDWSSSAKNPAKDVHWAAFYSDVEYEILPVTEGYRITLTYNLYHCEKNPVPTVDVSTSPFYNHLKSSLENPHFLRGGGTLGFTCQHAYVYEKFDKGKNLSRLLKGSDCVIFLAAKSLDLGVNV